MKPFLRWAGGKTWLLKYTEQLIDTKRINGYHEPFVGGGAVFFSLPKVRRVHLTDLNAHLINTYTQVRDNVSEVIKILSTYRNSKTFYNQLRTSKVECNIERAAQFIFLNQTSFNGIYRENLAGVYNVPYGYRIKDFIREDLLRAASLKLQDVNLRTHQFDAKLRYIREGDLVFLDPPYTITHNNNGFIKYNQKLFSVNDQHRLAKFIDAIVSRGAFYILTNAAHREIKEIFTADEPIVLSRASQVGAKPTSRGRYSEFLFTNLNHDIR